MSLKEHDKHIVDIVKDISPAVVSIAISKELPTMRGRLSDSLFGSFAPPRETEKTKVGGGSGFIVHADGLVLTNKHVVIDPDAAYTVIMGDDTEYPAKVLSRDPVNDIAVLKIEGKNLPVAPMGDSKKIQLGQTVLAIGNALGMFSNTVSKGIISGLARSIAAALGSGEHMEELRGVIQTDVAINQGNSGGPLIDLDGNVIAINTAVIYGAQNIGFSIPINWAKQDIKDILEHGRIRRPYIGLTYIMLGKEAQKKYALATDHGALVARDHLPGSVAVVPGSPADKAGIRENDIITEVNGEPLTEKTTLTEALQAFAVGETVKLSLIRNEKPMHVSLTLKERTA